MKIANKTKLRWRAKGKKNVKKQMDPKKKETTAREPGKGEIKSPHYLSWVFAACVSLETLCSAENDGPSNR